MNILHIDSSPRAGDSISRELAAYLSGQLKGGNVTYRDLGRETLPPLAAEDLIAIHGSMHQGTDELSEHLALSTTLIQELCDCDTLIIGLSMHNFSVPAVLKRWIDYVARAGLTFKYTENGPVGMTGIKTAFLVIASGGTPIGSNMDFASDYLSHICRFLGVEHVYVIDAAGSKREPEKIIARAKKQIDELVENQDAA